MTEKKPVRKIVTHKAAAERLEVIRRQNVQRHHKAAATTKLREEILRHTANRILNFELDRLHEASLRHSGLDAAGLNRLHDLKQKVIDK